MIKPRTLLNKPKRQSCLSDLRNEKCLYDGVPTPALSAEYGDLASDTEVCSYVACHSPRTKTHTTLPTHTSLPHCP